MSILDWVIATILGIVGIIVGIQQFSTGARQHKQATKFEHNNRLLAQDQFLRDWQGESKRPGHPAVPGVLERLQKIEAELKHNGGSSVKDAVIRIEQKLEAIDARLDDGNKRFDYIEEKIK